MVRAARTDTEAFAQLYDRYVQRLYRYCHHRTDNVRDAEDLTSQVFLAAMEAFPHYRQDGHFAAWLFTIARNKVVDHYRRTPNLLWTKRRPRPSIPISRTETELSHQKDTLLRLIQALAEDEQELIRLRYVAELPFVEVARALRKTEGATKKMLYRLLKRLRTEMEAAHE